MKTFLKITFAIFLTTFSFSTFAQRTAAATGNWSAPATWTAAQNTNRTGTVTSATNSTTVTGSGTSFTTELSVGSIIGTQGATAIGTVASITSNTSLTLTVNASNAVSAQSYRTTGGVPSPNDNVTIAAERTVTVDGSFTCASLQLGGTAANTFGILTFANSGSPKLTVSGATTVGGSGSSSSNRRGEILFVSGATLEAASVVLTQSTGGDDNPGTITMTSGSTLITGSFAVGQGTATWTPSTGSVKLKSTNTLPASVFTSFNSLQITGGTTTMGTSISCSTLVIDASTQLNVASSQTLTVNNGTGTDLTVHGTLSNAGTITQSASTTAAFNAGSTYTHAVNNGTIPTATWNATSTCSITGVTSTAPSGGSQTFGNLTWNCASQSGDVSFSVDLNITGNLTIMNSNSNQIRPNDGADHVIGGNYTHSGGNIRWARNSKTTLTVNGSMSITGGEVQLTNGSDSGIVYLKGNFSHTAGSLTETGSGTNAAGNIVFNGTSAQTFTSGGSVTQNINYGVISGAILQMAAASTAVHGNGFSLLSGGTLDIKSADGITKFVSAAADSSKGNIRTLNRSYSTAASYIYSGTAQTVGNGLTGAKNLTLSNSGTKTFAAANFTTNNLGVSVDLNINTSVIASIPNDNNITVSQKLYLAGVGKANGSYGSTTSSATNKTNTFFAATTGTVTATLSALPVTLSSFTAKPTPDNKVSLGWVTSTEQVNKGFRIERQAGSTNGKYEQIGFVGSKAKDGNSQNMLTYSFIDAAPKAGASSFYRLVQEDLDGKLTYSEVRVVKLNGQSVSMVFPNPSNGAVNISRTADGRKMNIQVIDQSGKIISQMNNITDANYRMNISQSGVYTIKMTYPETGEQSIQRVVIQK